MSNTMLYHLLFYSLASVCLVIGIPFIFLNINLTKNINLNPSPGAKKKNCTNILYEDYSTKISVANFGYINERMNKNQLIYILVRQNLIWLPKTIKFVRKLDL